jgi:hypothetical protein
MRLRREENDLAAHCEVSIVIWDDEPDHQASDRASQQDR